MLGFFNDKFEVAGAGFGTAGYKSIGARLTATFCKSAFCTDIISSGFKTCGINNYNTVFISHEIFRRHISEAFTVPFSDIGSFIAFLDPIKFFICADFERSCIVFALVCKIMGKFKSIALFYSINISYIGSVIFSVCIVYNKETECRTVCAAHNHMYDEEIAVFKCLLVGSRTPTFICNRIFIVDMIVKVGTKSPEIHKSGAYSLSPGNSFLKVALSVSVRINSIGITCSRILDIISEIINLCEINECVHRGYHAVCRFAGTCFLLASDIAVFVKVAIGIVIIFCEVIEFEIKIRNLEAVIHHDIAGFLNFEEFVFASGYSEFHFHGILERNDINAFDSNNRFYHNVFNSINSVFIRSNFFAVHFDGKILPCFESIGKGYGEFIILAAFNGISVSFAGIYSVTRSGSRKRNRDDTFVFLYAFNGNIEGTFGIFNSINTIYSFDFDSVYINCKVFSGVVSFKDFYRESIAVAFSESGITDDFRTDSCSKSYFIFNRHIIAHFADYTDAVFHGVLMSIFSYMNGRRTALLERFAEESRKFFAAHFCGGFCNAAVSGIITCIIGFIRYAVGTKVSSVISIGNSCGVVINIACNCIFRFACIITINNIGAVIKIAHDTRRRGIAGHFSEVIAVHYFAVFFGALQITYNTADIGSTGNIAFIAASVNNCSYLGISEDAADIFLCGNIAFVGAVDNFQSAVKFPASCINAADDTADVILACIIYICAVDTVFNFRINSIMNYRCAFYGTFGDYVFNLYISTACTFNKAKYTPVCVFECYGMVLTIKRTGEAGVAVFADAGPIYFGEVDICNKSAFDCGIAAVYFFCEPEHFFGSSDLIYSVFTNFGSIVNKSAVIADFVVTVIMTGSGNIFGFGMSLNFCVTAFIPAGIGFHAFFTAGRFGCNNTFVIIMSGFGSCCGFGFFGTICIGAGISNHTVFDAGSLGSFDSLVPCVSCFGDSFGVAMAFGSFTASAAGIGFYTFFGTGRLSGDDAFVIAVNMFFAFSSFALTIFKSEEANRAEVIAAFNGFCISDIAVFISNEAHFNGIAGHPVIGGIIERKSDFITVLRFFEAIGHIAAAPIPGVCVITVCAAIGSIRERIFGRGMGYINFGRTGRNRYMIVRNSVGIVIGNVFSLFNNRNVAFISCNCCERCAFGDFRSTGNRIIRIFCSAGTDAININMIYSVIFKAEKADRRISTAVFFGSDCVAFSVFVKSVTFDGCFYGLCSVRVSGVTIFESYALYGGGSDHIHFKVGFIAVSIGTVIHDIGFCAVGYVGIFCSAGNGYVIIGNLVDIIVCIFHILLFISGIIAEFKNTFIFDIFCRDFVFAHFDGKERIFCFLFFIFKENKIFCGIFVYSLNGDTVQFSVAVGILNCYSIACGAIPASFADIIALAVIVSPVFFFIEINCRFGGSIGNSYGVACHFGFASVPACPAENAFGNLGHFLIIYCYGERCAFFLFFAAFIFQIKMIPFVDIAHIITVVDTQMICIYRKIDGNGSVSVCRGPRFDIYISGITSADTGIFIKSFLKGESQLFAGSCCRITFFIIP